MSDITRSDKYGSDTAYPPYNFSWVVENKLAGMACPSTKENINFLLQNGIKHLVTLSEEELPPVDDADIQWTMISVEEFEAPSLKDIEEFIQICKHSHRKKEAVGVHCRMGRGRTGVMLACYLVYFQDMTPEKAVTHIRILRRGSVETYEQERIVRRFHDVLRGTKINK